MKIQFDEGYAFGLGAFETIAVEEGKPIFLDWHMERLEKALRFFNIQRKVSQEEITDWLAVQPSGKKAMKLMVSEKNTVFTMRENPYTEEKIKKGFHVELSKVTRNESSPLTCHKTLNYGDSILEKREAVRLGADERIFLNTKGNLSEGTTTNLFWVQEGRIQTPDLYSGILPGIMRRFVLENFEVEQGVFTLFDLEKAEEIFVTNSLMGIMPVTQYQDKKMEIGPITRKCMQKYLEVRKKM